MTNYNIYGRWGKIYDVRNKELCIRDYVAYFLDRTQSIFKYGNLPETMPQRDMELLVQTQGFGVYTEINDNPYVFRAGLGGRPNPYYMPTIATIANPALDYSATLEIDKECVVIPNDSTYMGLMPLMSKYATLLTEADISLLQTCITARQPYVITTTDDSSNASAERLISKIEKGELGLMSDDDFLKDVKTMPIGSVARIITDVIELKQYLRASFYNDIGLDANYNMKRESITSSEVNMNTDSLQPFIYNMLETRKLALEKINKLFGRNYTVELDSSWAERFRAEELNIEKMEAEVESLTEPKETEVKDSDVKRSDSELAE